MKQKIVGWLEALSRQTLKLAEQLSPKVETQKQPYAFLTPTSEIDEQDGKEYFDALKWALDSKEIKNIAITGPYGSGKSSILLSFQSKFPEYNFLNISLATFGNGSTDKVDDAENNASEKNHQLIEQSILQQIFYKKTQKEIPDSRFSRKSVLRTKRLVTYTVALSIWLLALCRLMNLGFSRQPGMLDNLLSRFSDEIDFIAYVVVILGIFKGLFESIRAVRKITFQRFKFSASNIEIEADKNTSPLNANFDELLYFFELTGYKGLIIEDLDRFQSTDIFSKLRELNLLLNNSEQIKGKPVVFIYGIKDDLFIVGDRTKFFDFIIPIVPVVSSSNAGDRLYQMLNEAGLSANLQQAYVYRIGSYITDMRMLKNIYNEYILYRKKIGIQAEDKLLGIIAYKNLYPKDFSDLHSGSGIIHNTFKGKAGAIEKISETLTSEITTLQETIAKLEAEIAQNVYELNTIYISKIRELLPPLESLYINGHRVPPAQAAKPEHFNRLRQLSHIQYYTSYTAQNSNVSLSEVEKEVDSSRSYDHRYRIIQEKESIDLANLKSELSRKQTRKAELHALSLRELLLTYEITIFSQELKDHDLLVYLLKYGAIDEQYQLYISNFYEGVLKRNDQEFLVAVKKQEEKAADFSLSNCGEIIKRLQVDDFRGAAILNIDLVTYLLEQRERHRIFLEPIVNQLITGNESAWSFLGFLKAQTNNKVVLFINLVCVSWPEFWQRVLGKYKDQDQEILSFFVVILQSCSVEVVKALDKECTIGNYLQNNYFEICDAVSEKEENKVYELIRELKIKVSKLAKTSATKSLQFLVKNRHYTLTADNIKFVLSMASEHTNESLLEKDFTFTAIMQSENAELIEYFYEDLNFGVDLLLSNSHNQDENPEEVIKLLKEKSLGLDLKMRLVETIPFELPTFTMFYKDTEGEEKDEDLSKAVLKHHRVRTSWANVSLYFEQIGVDEVLDEYLNTPEIYGALSKQKITDINNSEMQGVLITNIYVDREISEIAFGQISVSFTPPDVDILGDIPVERLKTLISQKTIPYNQEYLDSLTSLSDEIVGHFLQTNLKEIGSSDDGIAYQPEHVLSILRQPELSEEQALYIVDSLDSDTFADEPNLATAIADLIISHRLREIKPFMIEVILDVDAPVETKAALFKALTTMTEFTDLLPNLPKIGELYAQLYEGETQFKEADIDLAILKYLKKHSYISQFDIADGNIIITPNEY